MQEIAVLMNCSLHRVKYWLTKHNIQTRTISDAIYKWHNPKGDPFEFRPPETAEEYKLLGMGLGLYWGEGTKSDKGAVRLGNTDPKLIKMFIKFLVRFFGISKKDLRFGLQIFTDIDPNEALDFWAKGLNINKSQFQKVIVTISGSIGTYRKKSQYGVLTVLYFNTKLRNILVSLLPM